MVNGQQKERINGEKRKNERGGQRGDKPETDLYPKKKKKRVSKKKQTTTLAKE
jgi:hypothetical protein